VSSFDYDGFRIAYEVRGSGARPVVLIHGLLFARTHHYGLADALAGRGNRVILIDLLGHGTSDRPSHARHYSMETYAKQVVGLLDHLDIPQAAVGGTSLGANVSIETAHRAPDRVKGMFVEMPVLERAAPAAGVIFIPLMILLAQGATWFQAASNVFKRIPRGLGLYPDVLLDLVSQDPVPSAAVLHGVLAGRIAPHVSDREKIETPAIVIGHLRDMLHPFSDAEALNRELPNSELIQAASFFELRFAPNRLTDRIADFLDEIFA
jgi:pimeloyl-ACP methyl ester carboxylesterase